MKRREFLSTATVTATPAFIGLDWGPLGDPDEGDELEYTGTAPSLEDFPDHLENIRADLDELREYEPKLVTTPEARSDSGGMYGWSCESDEYEDLTAHYFWKRYNTQRSVFYWIGIDAGPDEHHLDHEPYICFVRPDGTIEQSVGTGGHHFAVEFDPEWGNFTEDRVPDRRTHANLVGVRPHNHYVEAPSGTEGGFSEGYTYFGSWLQVYETWFRNGRYDSTADLAVVDPFEFYDDGERDDYRTHWWRSDTWDAWKAKHLRMRWLSQRDELRIDE